MQAGRVMPAWVMSMCVLRRRCRVGWSSSAASHALSSPPGPHPPQFKEYLARAEYLKGVIDGKQPAEEAPAGGPNGAAAAKGKPAGGGGGGDGKQVRQWEAQQQAAQKGGSLL